ncbi:hypothetical protein SAMN05443245_6891 [Paraburkholderia fungorum]|uniref:Uncharacterized protein n=2 Tax=Paraburkholderia fungorum TaxID=134537 RepID=A0A1H1JN07_9BURK|nr:hypothetical protein SAMN05443245_6891 [Paraburkholderia fungorum]
MNRIENLPERFPLSNLSKFYFGEPDGRDDPLLESCILPITPVLEFLEENKSIVVGDRGTGKTALFRLLAAGRLEFKSAGKLTQIYVAIDEELAYKTLKTHIIDQIKDPVNTPDAPHRIVWEVYLLSRCLETLNGHYSADKEFLKIRDEFFKIIGKSPEQKMGLLDLIKSTKKSFGVKLEGGHMGYMVPNFYASVEPSANVANTSDDALIIDVPQIKRDINNFLRAKKTVVYLLLDKIDEFVAGDEYDTQKATLQALIHTWRDFQSYPSLKPKLFLRRDLFERLDFSAIGRDKIDPKKTELKWSSEDIRQFIASRIFHNFVNVLGRRNLRFNCNAESLKLDRKLLTTANADPDALIGQGSFMDYLKLKLLHLQIFLSSRKRDEYDARNTSAQDAACQALITAIFPRKVSHNVKGKKNVPIDLDEYLSTHFHFANGHTTPRVMLQFLNSCVEKSKEYYRGNPDQNVSLNTNGEYPLILREHVTKAYAETREISLKTIIGLSEEFKRPAMLLMQTISRSRNIEKFTYADAKKHIGKLLQPKIDHGEPDQQLQHFLAFYEHAGLFRCTNRAHPLEQRSYELPLMFQQSEPLAI